MSNFINNIFNIQKNIQFSTALLYYNNCLLGLMLLNTSRDTIALPYLNLRWTMMTFISQYKEKKRIITINLFMHTSLFLQLECQYLASFLWFCHLKFTRQFSLKRLVSFLWLEEIGLAISTDD